tara:strand:- start:3057 stop:5222 length:2166 start_codon:yes stop_codon:yes gene_type:complete
MLASHESSTARTRARVMPSETSSVEVNVDVDVDVDVERDGWRRPEARRRRGNARDDDDAYVFGADKPRETAALILSDDTPSADATAKSAAVGGVRVDALVDDTFGVRIPGSSDADEGREGLVRAARRFGGEAQREAWRSRLEVPLAKDGLGNQREDLQQYAAFVDTFHDTNLDVQTYSQTTSKYINLSYYNNRVEPQTRFPDGTLNSTPVRVANWIFAEEFAQRDGFVEEATTTDDDDEDDASETASEEDEAPTSCFGCFARSKSRVAVRSGSTSQKNIAREDEFEEEARESSPLERARETLAVCEEELAHAELNCRQMLLDLKRLVRSLEGNFTPEMQLNDPRAKELQEEIKDLEDSLKRLLDVRDEKHAEAAARRREIAEYERRQKSMKEQQAVSVAETVTDEIAIAEAMASRKDPLERFGTVGSLTSCMFLLLAPLYLWRYYEWIQFNRVTKRRLKSRTTTLTVYFYNPLLVPGARRLRLAASNIELTSMVLAVQSLLSFQLWITDQSDEIRPTLIGVYEYILLNTFARVAVPCSNSTILALRRRKETGRETSVKKLWQETSNAGVYKEYEFRDRDDVSDYDVALLDERSRHSEEIVEAAGQSDLDSFKEALDDLDPQARKEAVRVRVKNEMVQGRGRFFEHFGVSLNLSLQSSAEEKKVDSRLDVDEAASVLNAMTKLSQKHKKRFAGRTGYFPNNANARDVDVSALAKPVEDDDDE